MNPFTRFSLNNTLVIGLLIALVTAAGIYYGKTLQMEAMPNIALPIVTVATIYPGASPEDISETVSQPLQKSLAGIQGIEQIDATSNENVSLLILQFDFSKDTEKAQREVQDAVDRVKMPELVQKPIVSRIRMNSMPIMSYSISGAKDENTLRKLLNDRVKPAVLGVPGVSSVSVDGIRDDEVFIKVDEKKLQEANLSLQNVQQALSTANIAFPAGNTDISGESLPVKISSRTLTIEDIKAIPMIAVPNTAKMTGEAMSKVTDMITGLYSALSDMGSGMASLGKATAQNFRAVGLLAQMQQSQSTILTQSQILANPSMPPESRLQAQKAVETATQVAQAAGQELSSIFAEVAKTPNQGTANTPPMNSSAQLARPQGTPQATSQGTSPANTASSVPVSIVFLGDVARVDVGKSEAISTTRANGKPAVLVRVYKNDDANTVTVAEGVRSELASIEESGSELEVEMISDSSTEIRTSVEGMLREGLLGALFAVVVIALFLVNARATVIAVVSIPLSILISLILMPRFGITINNVSLSGMAVAIGRIVDDSIVVIENIHRRLNLRNQSDSEKTDSSLIKTIGEAVSEVSSAITSSTVTTCAVFIPLSFVSGMVGKFMVPFAITVVICILASLLVALTVVPVMSKLMMRRIATHKEQGHRMTDAYRRILLWSLSHRAIVVVSAVVLVVLSLALIPSVGVQFMPKASSTIYTARLEMPPGTSLDRTTDEIVALEKYLLEDEEISEEITSVTSTIGDTSGNGGFVGNMQGRNEATMTVVVKEASSADSVIARTKKHLKEESDSKWVVSGQSMTGTTENVEVLVTGDDLSDIRKAAHLIVAELQNIENLDKITNNLSVTKPEISVRIDSERAAAKGMSPIMVAGMVRSAFSFDKVSTTKLNGRDMNVLLGYDSKGLDSLNAIKNIKVTGLYGPVSLKDVADIAIVDGPASISERDGMRNATVTADVMGKDTVEVANDVKLKLDAMSGTLPEGVKVTVGGSSEMIQEGFTQMGLAMLTAIMLVFITMLLGLREPSAAFAIIFSLPFAAVGALFTLVITKTTLSMSGLIGILMLIGIVVTNAIVLMDRVLSNRAAGMAHQEALLEAGAIRLRPILMTAAATIMALLPLALGLSEGGFIGVEVALVVIGGLTLSTVLTLVIVPVTYSLMTAGRAGTVERAGV